MRELKYEEAYRILSAEVRAPEMAKTFASLAECAYQLGHYDEVPGLVAAASIGLQPEEEHVLHLAGIALLKTGRCQEA